MPTETYQFESHSFYHGRPDGCDRYSIDAADADEAVRRAVALESAALDQLGDTAEHVRIEVYFSRDEEPLYPVQYWDGSEWHDAERCEVCSVETFPDIQLDESLCASCAANFDSDYARSYGPHQEID